MRHHCNKCNSKVDLKGGERTNLRCNVCGGKAIILDEDVTLKCDLCMPCKLPDIQQRKIKANEIFNAGNDCTFASMHGQNATWVIIPVKQRSQKPQKDPTKEVIKPKRKYTKRNPSKKKAK